MSDFNSSLPIRTQTNGDAVVEICDGTTPSQKLAVDAAGLIGSKVYDVAGAGLTSDLVGGRQALDVYLVNSATGMDVSPATQNITVVDATSSTTTGANGQSIITGTPDAGSAASFSFSSFDTVSIQVSGTWTGTLQSELSQDGGTTWYKAWVFQSGTEVVASSWTANFEGWANVAASTNFRLRATAAITGTATVGIVESANVNSVNIANAVSVTQGTTPWVENLTQVGGSSIALGQTTMSASLPVAIASDQSAVPSNITEIAGSAPSASNSLAVQISTGSAYVSPSNPLPVTIDPAAGGAPVIDYKDASAIGSGSSDNHDYTVTSGKTLYLQSIESSGSGKAKMVLEIETGVSTNTFNTYGAQFNSTATPNMEFPIAAPVTVAAGVRVRVVMTNRDLLSQDLYSTIMGYEV